MLPFNEHLLYTCQVFYITILLCVFIQQVFSSLPARHQVLLTLIITMKPSGRYYYSCLINDEAELRENTEPGCRISITNILVT